MKIEDNGRTYEIENWDDFSEKLLTSLGFLIEDDIRRNIREAKLVSSGELITSIKSKARKQTLLITSDAPHAVYVEYGTAGTRKGVVDPYGEASQPANPERKMPIEKEGESFTLVKPLKRWARKKGIPESAYFGLARHIQMYGMAPFAPFRKTIYNERKMKELISKAGRIAANNNI